MLHPEQVKLHRANDTFRQSIRTGDHITLYRVNRNSRLHNVHTQTHIYTVHPLELRLTMLKRYCL